MKRRDIIISIIVSILVHIFMVVLFVYVIPPNIIDNEQAGPIEVFLDNQAGNGWQIADIPKPLTDETPEKSKFIGMYNQKTSEETVAISRPPNEGGDSGQKSESKKSTAKQQKQEIQNKEVVSKKSYDFDKKLFAMQSPFQEEQNKAEGGKPMTGGNVPEDFYPDYKKGEHTYVNVLRYPDVEYFVRLKRIFKTTWNPVSALHRDMSANSVSHGSISVVLAVSVNKGGSLAELFVLKSSGLTNYDEEAIRTIRASSPFSSPPDKFLEKDGLLRMSWTFVVYM